VEKIERRTTGVTGLDFPLDGGFPIGTSIVVYGHPLSGVDLMAKQFWKPETSEEKEEGTYMILDEDPSEGMIDVKDANLEKIVKKIEQVRDRKEGSRIIIDSLSTLIQKYGTEEVLAFIRNDIKETLIKGPNVMFTLYEGLHKEEEMLLIMRAVDIFVQLREAILGNEVERTFWIRKIKGQRVPQRVVPFLITEKGLELSTTSRVV
jgi:KaiC/GvpD/RAD55 family RecA-like ATPase